MTDTTVKVFQSTDTGAPSVSGTAGALITLLDACLIDGYGSVTLDSVVIAGNVATCTKSTGHGFTAIGTVGPVIRMSGVSVPSALNADWRITVVSSTVFTFTTSGLSDQTATGTIAAKRAPLGYSKAFTGTNKAAYRQDSTASTRLYLRVADDGTGSAAYARVRGYETMSDVDTGTGLFPTEAQLSGGSYLHKSNGANSTARAWRIIGDDRGFYLFVKNDGTSWYAAVFYGDINSFKAGDAYHYAMLTQNTSSVASGAFQNIANDTSGAYLARTYTQLGSSVLFSRYGHKSHTYIGYGTPMAYPNPVNNSFHAIPVDVWESTVMRGLMPGLYDPVHATAVADNTVIESIPSLLGRSLWCLSTQGTYCAAFDITGPWR